MAEIRPTWSQPSHPTLIRVIPGSRPFSKRSVALVSLPANSLFTPIDAYAPASSRSYSTVQVSATESIELLSDLLYTNHSCVPSLVFDVAAMEVRVAPDRPLKAGDELTFFYPSTEWTMAQSFDCECERVGPGGKCNRVIKGAGDTEEEYLKGMWLNEFIKVSLKHQSMENSVQS